MTNLYSSKQRGFAEDNFKFHVNGGKFFEGIENTGKKRYCSLQAIFLPPPPPFFFQDFLQTKRKGRLVWERVNIDLLKFRALHMAI